MLAIHVFNVGHGDSLLIEFPDRSWGVIDSNRASPSLDPPALTYLRQHKVGEVAFVCLTHPHEDHYSGLSNILQAYEGHIEELWIFRLDSAHWRKFLLAQYQSATTPSRRRSSDELRTIFMHLERMRRKGKIRLLDANVSLADHGSAKIDCLAPHPKQLGAYQIAIAKQAENPAQGRIDENLLSVVLRIRYGNATLIFSADAPTRCWIDILREARKRKESLTSALVKVGHHGSRHGFCQGAWEEMTKPHCTNAAISAGSDYGHPDADVLKNLFELKVRLHCTNYPSFCLKGVAPDLSKFSGLPESLKLGLLMLDQAPNVPEIPCNGDLHFQVGLDGTVATQHQSNGYCPLHAV